VAHGDATPAIHVARWAQLDARTAYGILRLRAAVFVVEQRCAYLDADGRDLEPGARHLWMNVEDEVACYLRLLRQTDGAAKIGRVATDPRHRGRGYAAALMRHAIELAGRPIVLKAQAQLRDWYARFGFSVCGEPWTEDGIPHVPMRID